MKTKTYLITGSLFVLVLSLFLLSSFNLNVVPSQDEESSATLQYNSLVCPTVTRIDGTIEKLPCSHNVLYNTGMNHTMKALFWNLTSDTVSTIELCNSSYAGSRCDTPVVAGTEAYFAYVDSGLAKKNGSIMYLNNGNTSIYTTFTATADAKTTNVTRLTSWSGVNFSGNSFTPVTLQTNDQLTLNWSIWITS